MKTLLICHEDDELNRVHASDTYFCVNYGVCDTLTIGTLRTHQSLSPLTLTGFIDRSDSPFSPTKGYVGRVDFESASAYTYSDYRYNRAFIDAAVYGHRSGTAHVYSAHVRLGVVKALSSGPDAGVLHPRKRFYAGGANSVRGYAESQLGPRILTIDVDSLIKGAASVGGGRCLPTIDAIKFCDPNTSALPDDHFTPQPLGGTSLIEASLEYRFPLPLPSRRPLRLLTSCTPYRRRRALRRLAGRPGELGQSFDLFESRGHPSLRQTLVQLRSPTFEA